MKSTTEMRSEESKGEKNCRWQDKEVATRWLWGQSVGSFFFILVVQVYLINGLSTCVVSAKDTMVKKKKLPCPYVA